MRVPVAGPNLMAPGLYYAVNKRLMARVDRGVRPGFENDMYVIIHSWEMGAGDGGDLAAFTPVGGDRTNKLNR
jgi:hypothetical protein